MGWILFRRGVLVLAIVSAFSGQAHGLGAFTPLPTLARQYNAGLTEENANGYATLSTPHKKFVFVPDVRRVTVNGLVLHMNAPYIVRNGTGAIAGVDANNFLHPLLDELDGSPPISATPVIVIDPGHGGEDSGALGAAPGLREKDLVLQISQRVRDLLGQTGMTVRLTRERDEFLTLQERVDLVARWKADVFISIHVNASPNKQAGGVETYVIPAAGFPSTEEGSRVDGPFAGNGQDAENTRLAYYVHKGLVSKSGATDRGVRRARYEVLRNVQCPALLVECGFISNADDAWLLRKDAYRDKVAGGIASGIMTYVSRRTAATRPLPVWTEPAPAAAPSLTLTNATHNPVSAPPEAPPQTPQPSATIPPPEPTMDEQDPAQPPMPTLPPRASIGMDLPPAADASVEPGGSAEPPASPALAPSTVTPIE